MRLQRRPWKSEARQGPEDVGHAAFPGTWLSLLKRRWSSAPDDRSVSLSGWRMRPTYEAAADYANLAALAVVSASLPWLLRRVDLGSVHPRIPTESRLLLEIGMP